MKTFKFKLLIPVVAIIFALTSAFATSTSSNVANLAIVDGYIDSPAPCTQKVDCSPDGEILCTNAQGQQAFGKMFPSQTTCPLVVFRP
ncbi:DUF6520 family protein [Changchengzhania lutea]|uniref:DUF6520 family protein n=1 Tax=Changchengzhania lutea TaxID=2049305 RepID=UPI00115E77A4|nr:DUF6520 family protein [Changchengzhania lutea]